MPQLPQLTVASELSCDAVGSPLADVSACITEELSAVPGYGGGRCRLAKAGPGRLG